MDEQMNLTYMIGSDKINLLRLFDDGARLYFGLVHGVI